MIAQGSIIQDHSLWIAMLAGSILRTLHRTAIDNQLSIASLRSQYQSTITILSQGIVSTGNLAVQSQGNTIVHLNCTTIASYCNRMRGLYVCCRNQRATIQVDCIGIRTKRAIISAICNTQTSYSNRTLVDIDRALEGIDVIDVHIALTLLCNAGITGNGLFTSHRIFQSIVIEGNCGRSHILCKSYLSALSLIIEDDVIAGNEDIGSIICLLLEVALVCQIPYIILFSCPNHRRWSTQVFYIQRQHAVSILQGSLMAFQTRQDDILDVTINLLNLCNFIGTRSEIV